VTATATRVAAYGVHWNGHLGRLGKTIDAAEARGLHDAGKLYSAVLGEPERPSAVVEVRLEVPFVGVRFLDERARTFADYAFGRVDGGPDDALFLRQAIELRFSPDGTVEWCALHVFDPDGLVQVEEKDYARGETTRYEAVHDASRNHERVPAFGDYDSVARLER
jgi:uncharacterized protein with GYD domain